MSPIWGSTPRRTDRLTVGRNVTLTLSLSLWPTPTSDCLSTHWLVCLVNCRWLSPGQSFLVPSPAGLMTIFYCLTTLGTHWLQSSQMLQALVSTVDLDFGRVGTHGLIYVRSKTVNVFRNGISSSTRGGICPFE
jgi:hypothetical protein